jgi:hypothetical protein
MTKAVIVAALSLFTLLIVLPIKSFVNQTVGNPILHDLTLRVDGNPYPPLPPKKLRLSPTTLVADGNPYPPLPPKKLRLSPTTLVADGNPYPPLPPKKLRNASGSLVRGSLVS